MSLPDEAISSYSRALTINALYSDCYFNLGNIYLEDKNDLHRAEICYRSALESLEENKKIDMYRRLEENPREENGEGEGRGSIITFGRVCNMIGEISKRKNDYEAAIKFYLRGIS